MAALLPALFRYKAWANGELLAAIGAIEEAAHPADRETAIRILNHTHVVDRIFAANLQGRAHDFTATNTKQTPSLAQLAWAVGELDRWYVDYVEGLDAAQLAAALDFTFTDGQHGRMTREEMLAHLIAHGTYHRGAIGRILVQLSIPAPRDLFTGYLHQAQPARREVASP